MRGDAHCMCHFPTGWRVWKSGAIGVFERLFEAPPSEGRNRAEMVYFTPDKAKFKSYTKILLEPVQIWH